MFHTVWLRRFKIVTYHDPDALRQVWLDQVNLAMLENILEEEDDAFVFFYEDNDTDAHTILEELEQVRFPDNKLYPNRRWFADSYQARLG